MTIYPVAQQWVEVTDVTPLATVFGPEWQELPVPPRLDVRWRAVFGYSSLASRVINYLVTRSTLHAYGTLGALATHLHALYTVEGRFGRGIGLIGTAYLLAALAIAPAPAPVTPPPSARAIQQAAARQLRVVAASIQEQVTPDSLATLQQIHQTLQPLCAPVS